MTTAASTRLKVTEIFHSIQGESTLAGERFVFVRLTGCPLRCTYCDTTYSYTGGKWMEIPQILEEVKSHSTRWVCLTGGEPLVQKNSLELVKALHGLNYKISIETDGEEDISAYTSFAKIIMDIKTPSSGEKAEKCFSNLEFITTNDEIKFVIGSEEDFLFSKNTLEKYGLQDKCTVLFSPVYGGENMKWLAEKVISEKLPVRFQTQLHKHIWGPNTTGV